MNVPARPFLHTAICDNLKKFKLFVFELTSIWTLPLRVLLKLFHIGLKRCSKLFSLTKSLMLQSNFNVNRNFFYKVLAILFLPIISRSGQWIATETTLKEMLYVYICMCSVYCAYLVCMYEVSWIDCITWTLKRKWPLSVKKYFLSLHCVCGRYTYCMSLLFHYKQQD